MKLSAVLVQQVCGKVDFRGSAVPCHYLPEVLPEFEFPMD